MSSVIVVAWVGDTVHLVQYPSLVLVQPRKTRPCLTERLLMGRKESNQTNKSSSPKRIIDKFVYWIDGIIT